jgi:seryl-tRNA synthetase
MNDIKRFRDDPAGSRELLKLRGFEINPETDVLPFDTESRGLNGEVEAMRAERNNLGAALGNYYKGNPDGLNPDMAEAMRLEAADLRERLQAKEAEMRVAQENIQTIMLGIPNFPLEITPVGLEYEDYRLVYEWGDKPNIDKPIDHGTIGSHLRILDTEAGTLLAGPRFSVLRDKGAKLQRSLINFFLDQSTGNGYVETVVPVVVNEDSLLGTGQLPKFREDIFETEVGGRDMFLSPTAEVQLTNLAGRNKLYSTAELPVKLTAYSENFRAEAGSAGRDTTGIFRQHQFPKVELVRIVHPDESWNQLEELTMDAEGCLRALGLHYRKVALSTGDIGFSAAFTYDLEVWLPGQGQYREASSCSLLTDFQARRLNTRVLDEESGQKRLAHTVNGSALAVGRTMVAILEQGLQEDGSVVIPEVLADYTKFDKIDLNA